MNASASSGSSADDGWKAKGMVSYWEAPMLRFFLAGDSVREREPEVLFGKHNENRRVKPMTRHQALWFDVSAKSPGSLRQELLQTQVANPDRLVIVS